MMDGMRNRRQVREPSRWLALSSAVSSPIRRRRRQERNTFGYAVVNTKQILLSHLVLLSFISPRRSGFSLGGRGHTVSAPML